jgi:hypothetical protein
MKSFVLAPLVAYTLAGSAAAAQETPSTDPRRHDIDLRPYVAWVEAPQSATSAAIGADLGLRLTRLLELSLDGAWYAPFNDLQLTPQLANSFALATRPTTVNEMTASSDLTLVLYPLASQTEPNEIPGTIEPYALGGAGVVLDHPIPVVDTGRSFGDNDLVSFVVGAGARMFLTRWLALSLDARDLMYFEKRENPTIASGSASLPLADPNNPMNPSTWYAPSSYFTNDLQVRLGLSFVLRPH